MQNKTSVILLAGGTGTRMKTTIPKQYLHLKGKPIALYSFEMFCSMPEISEIVVVCDFFYRSLFEESFHCQNPNIRLAFAEPGLRRQDSVFHGLEVVAPDSDYVCIHDSARPMIKKEMVHSALQAAQEHGAAAIGMPLKFTVKECSHDRMVLSTPDRSRLWEIQTPQVIRRSLLKEGFTHAIRDNLTVTDDTSLVELIDQPVKLVEGAYSNIKITTPEDLSLVERILDGEPAVEFAIL